jgi:hypothetical protein
MSGARSVVKRSIVELECLVWQHPAQIHPGETDAGPSHDVRR